MPSGQQATNPRAQHPCGTIALVKDKLRRWAGISYLSRFERVLNRSLWALTVISLIYCVAQHVFLANVPEVFHDGAAWGDLFYDLAVAYIGAFVFYLLVVRLPLRRDRRNVWTHLDPLLGQLPGIARSLMRTLNKTAGFEESRENSRANIHEVCEKLGPNTASKQMYLSLTPGQPVTYPTVISVINSHVARVRGVLQQVLNQSTFLSSDIVRLMNDIDQCDLFFVIDGVGPMFAVGNTSSDDLTPFADNIFDYLIAVEQLDEFRQQFTAGRTPMSSRRATGEDRDHDNLIPLTRSN
jgi:hypothetical protein